MERRPCCLLLMLFFLAAVCMTLVGYLRIQRDLMKKLTVEFELSVTTEKQIEQNTRQLDLDLQQMKKQVEDTKKEVENLQDEVKQLTLDQEQKNKEVEECQNSKATLNNDIAAVEKDKSDTEGNFVAVKSKWSDITQDLQKKLQEFSPVCVYVKQGSDAGGQCPQTAVKNQTVEEQKKS